MTAPVSEIILKMTRISGGNLHDINHFMKVWAFAKTIGEREIRDETALAVLETAAVLHDIACPLCREKYGSTHGPYQEAEGAILAADFLKDSGLPQSIVDRVVYLVGHHHTYNGVDGPDYQILLEADFLVNAEESAYAPEVIRRAQETIFKTTTGTALLRTLYNLP